MRASLLFPLFLLAGFGAGIALFHRSVPLVAPVMEAERKESTEPAARPESLAGTAGQRLLSAAFLKGDYFERENALYLAIESLRAEDFRRLAAAPVEFKAIGEKLRKMDQATLNQLAFALVARWLAVDPAGAMNGALRVLDLIPAIGAVRNMILDALAAKKPEDLLALISSTMDGPARNEIISRALRALAIRDEAKAQAWLNACTDPSDKLAGGAALRAGAVQANPLRAIELAGSIEDKKEGRALLRAAAQHAAQMGPGVLRQLATTPMPPWMLEQVFDLLGLLYPELAVDLAVKHGAAQGLDRTSLQVAFSSLARRDQAKAIAKLEGLTGRPRSSAVMGIGMVWVGREPANAMNWLIQQPDGIASPDGGEGAAVLPFRRWMQSAPEDARRWADTLPPGEDRDIIQTHLAVELALNKKPAEAVQVLARLDSPADPEIVAEITAAWTRLDPQAAAEWAAAQPLGALQNGAIVSIVRTWASENPRQVAEWLSQFPAGEARDRSIIAYLDRGTMSQAGTKERGAEFDTWFDLVNDPWQRTKLAGNRFWQLSRRDPAGARTWLASLSNVDPELIRQILRDGK